MSHTRTGIQPLARLTASSARSIYGGQPEPRRVERVYVNVVLDLREQEQQLLGTYGHELAWSVPVHGRHEDAGARASLLAPSVHSDTPLQASGVSKIDGVAGASSRIRRVPLSMEIVGDWRNNDNLQHMYEQRVYLARYWEHLPAGLTMCDGHWAVIVRLLDEPDVVARYEPAGSLAECAHEVGPAEGYCFSLGAYVAWDYGRLIDEEFGQ